MSGLRFLSETMAPGKKPRVSPLETAVRSHLELLRFRVLGLRLAGDEAIWVERTPRKRRLQGQALVRDRRPHHPGQDLLYLVDIRTPYKTEQYRDVGRLLKIWRDYYRIEYDSLVQFIYQHHGRRAALYIVRQVLTMADIRAAEKLKLESSKR